ncbi:hypothetical protein ABTZ99_32685 [Actinosynnema sp. NPDC002837]
MTLSVLFLGEGTSDSGIVPQVELCAARLGIEVAITDPDLGRLPNPPGKSVVEKLRASLLIGGHYDLVIVHRDADRDGREARLREISIAFNDAAPDILFTSVIPIRMTEAWLLTNEYEIRTVAGNPRGRTGLNLPSPARVESVADPKKLLKEVLGVASGLTGRKLAKFHDRFSQHRRQLLERLDPDGPIQEVSSWRNFMTDLESGLIAAVDKNVDNAVRRP